MYLIEQIINILPGKITKQKITISNFKNLVLKHILNF